MQRHAYDFPYVVQTFESPLAQEAKSSRTARVAFGYSPLFGCLLLTSPPVLLEKDTVARWFGSPIITWWVPSEFIAGCIVLAIGRGPRPLGA